MVEQHHFIPISSQNLVSACLNRIDSTDDKQRIADVAERLQALLHQEFHRTQTALIEAYSPIDPDLDTVSIAPQAEETFESDHFKGLFEGVLKQANFIRLSRDDLQAALKESSLFNIRLDINFDDFDDALLYCRGVNEKTETIAQWFGLRKKTITFTNYDRVVLYLRFKAVNTLGDNAQLLGRSGRTMLKLFRNVPKADLEMLFPNTRIGMRTVDKLLIGVPALVSGVVVLTTKLGATLVLLGGLFGFWLGLHQKPVELNVATLLALGAGLGTLAGYCWKQFSTFKNRKLRFAQALTQNLYFKSLDNNAGVFYRLIAEAEDEEFKEAFLAWFFLLHTPELSHAADLDSAIEQWFKALTTKANIDFEIEDALNKLERLGLAENNKGLWTAISAEEAQAHLISLYSA